MKSTILTLILISFSLVQVQAIGTTEGKKQQVTATFKGTTDEGGYKFVDEKKQTITFEELSYDVDIDLYDDEHIGQKFVVTWEDAETEEYDDEGDPTGDMIKIKRIVGLATAK